MKPVNQNIDKLKVQSILKAERSAALGADASSDLSAQRIKALDYYMGDMKAYMPASDGQSSAVSSDVQDVVEGVLPIILDVLTSGDKVIEFRPTGPEDAPAASQETEYVNHVFYQENDGFLVLHNALKDALLQKNCFVKWWMEPDETREREQYKGLTQASLGVLIDDHDVEIIDIEQYQDNDPQTNQPTTYFNVVTEAVKKALRPRVAAFPPEEWLISKNARNIADAPYLAHIQRKPQADLIALFPEKEADIKAAPAAVLTSDNSEAFARQTVQDNQDQLATADDANKDMRMVEAAEHFVRMALEEDKVARRYKITTVGEGYTILDIEEVTAWPVASGTPIIMPHRFFGRSLADLTIDVQEVKTSLMRATLNNAYFANNQRTEVSESHASDNTIDDLLNNRVGGIVRTRAPGGLTPIPTQSIGGWIMPTIEYMDSVRENRTGVGKGNTGLDIDSMNHARTGAVSRIMDAAEMRVKMMARVFAETLIVDMFRGIHGMLQEFQEEQHVVELTGGWVPVNPREWKTRRRMKVSLPIGGVGKQQMLSFFGQVLNIQKEALAQQGDPNGPLVSLENIYYTVDQMTKAAGLKGADGFFMKPPPPNPNAPKAPDPKMVEAQGKAQALQAQTQAKIAGGQAEAQANQAQQQAEFAHDTQMAQLKAASDRQREQDEFAHKQAMDKLHFEHDQTMEQMKAGFQLRLEAYKTQEQLKIDREQAALQAKQGVGEV